MSVLQRFAPILTWAPGYRRSDLRGDLSAGLTVGAMLIPQGMAYAMLAGLPPEVGLYASTLPLIAYAIFGTSRQLAVGPVAIVSLLTASSLAPIAEQGTAQYVAAAALLALIVGGVHLVLGFGRLGFVVNLLSHSVLVGFTAAAALIIGLSQVKHLLGIRTEQTEGFVETLREVLGNVGGTSWPTVAVAATAIAMLVALRRWKPAFPAALAVVAASAVAVELFGLERHGVKVVGDIPASLPGLGLPSIDAGLVGDLLPTALVITLVGFMESIAIAKVYARRNRYEVDPNQELIGIGAANVTAGVFGGYPVTGGFSRTAVNGEAGARTPLASIITAGIIILTLLLLTPLFQSLPNATLGAIIVVAVAGLFDVAEARHIARVKRSDLIQLGVAFVATLALGIELGIGVAVVASLIVVFARIMSPHTAELGRLPGTAVYRNLERFADAERIPEVAILRLDVSLNFANVAFLKKRLARLEAAQGAAPRAVVLDASGVNDIDASAEQALREVLDEYADRGIELHLANVKGPVRDVLLRSSLWRRLDGALHATVDDAVTVITGEALDLDLEPADRGGRRAPVDERE